VSDAKYALSVHEVLKGDFPVLDDSATQSLTITPGPAGVQPVVGAQERGWQFRSADGAWTVALMPEFFSLQTSKYTVWEEFRDRLEQLVESVSQHLTPAMERRLGLRYIDRLSEETAMKPIDWRGRVEDHVLGPISHPGLGDAVSATQQLVHLDVGDDLQVLLRHGCGIDADEDDRAIYLLDHDCYREVVQPFDPKTILLGADKLHMVALQVFQAAITTTYYAQLKGGES
jgi:uncharacterized protein (TIGR04255 family)